jgi:hypothetical protein
MFDVRKQPQKPVVVIRAATGNELSNYEKRKLATIEEKAQENKIEVIKLNNEILPIDPLNKEVQIVLGDLASKQKVTEKELDPEELFIIECELKES